MRLPETLREAIEEEVATVGRATLARSARMLSESYRGGDSASALPDAAARTAYLVTRVPATYAANVAVYRELKLRVNAPIESMLDMGAGPGTSLWAASEELRLQSFTALERDAHFVAIARRLASRSANEGLVKATWLQQDLRTRFQAPAHDLVVLSYSLGELPDPQATVRAAWNLAKVALVLIEPGTPAGFANVLRARDLLMGLGAHVAAPCPHHNACPLAARNDWCHFTVRLERTAEHRQLKGGDLGYEDEKFSYLIACKAAVRRPESRIVRHPLKHPGHVKFTLCTANDLLHPTVSKSQKDLYRAARKAEWGDAWPPDVSES
jgi:ribosomal protein RSM22 (predicted rRNA methylase)